MRIAIVKISAIGDIVHTMVVLQFIKKNYPESSIDWFVDETLKGVLENNPHINQIHSIRSVSYTHLTLPTIYSV